MICLLDLGNCLEYLTHYLLLQIKELEAEEHVQSANSYVQSINA